MNVHACLLSAKRLETSDRRTWTSDCRLMAQASRRLSWVWRRAIEARLVAGPGSSRVMTLGSASTEIVPRSETQLFHLRSNTPSAPAMNR